MLREGTQLKGRYILGQAEGQGGFSICYRAWDGVSEEIVAIKELFPSAVARRHRDGRVSVEPRHEAAFDDAMRCISHEAEVLQRLALDPAIVKVRDFFPENGTAYLTAEFLRGQPYDKYLQSEYNRHGVHLSVAGAVNIALRVLGALAAVHARGLLHLDVKPSNIRAAEGNQFVLLDFGSARDAFRRGNGRYGDTFTPGFAALEQHRDSGTTSPATDVHGLAATLYYSLSLQVPVPADQRAEGVPLQPLSELNPTVPKALEAIVEKALALDAGDRHQTVLEMKQALEPFGVTGFDAPWPTPPAPRQALKADPAPDTFLARRFVAWVLDISLALVATYVLSVTRLLPPEQVPGTLILIWWATQLAAGVTRATFGVWAMGLRFADEAGGRIRFGSLLIRTLLLMPPMALCLFQLRTDSGGLLRQDRISRSRVELNPRTR
jgi:serine/threonine protein kinase